MQDRSAADAEGVRFADDAARKLLARAIELDASRSSELSLAQLRDVATEAGISRSSFDAALNEMRPAPKERVRSPRRWVGVLVAAALVALLAIVVLSRWAVERSIPAVTETHVYEPGGR